MQKIEALKEHFRNGDPGLIERLDKLEKSLKKNSLLSNLAEHDGVKMILDTCDDLIERYSQMLEDQSAENLTIPAEQIKRVRWEAYRYQLAWFRNIFTIAKSNVVSKEKQVDNLNNGV